MPASARAAVWGIVFAVAAASLAIVLAVVAAEAALRDTSHLSGWTLLGLAVFLSAFGLRKKLAHPPLLAAGTWLKLHLGAGILVLVAFGMHLRGAPDGRLEWLLAVLFGASAASGLIGWWLSRAIPRRLAALGEDVIFERIPILAREIRDRAQELAAAAEHESSRSILGDIYARYLHKFFAVPVPWWRTFSAQARSNRLRHELRDQRRYLAAGERAAADELERLLRRRAVLDTHQAWQGLLKGWLFAHVPLSLALLIVAAVHVLVVHAFSGARP